MKEVMKKYGIWFFVVYTLLCLSPYFISGLNVVHPTLFGFPFTVWPILLLVMLCLFYLNYLSKHVWDGYDPEVEEPSNITPAKEGGE